MDQLKQIITDVIETNSVQLSSLSEDSMKTIAKEMFHFGMITRAVAKRPTFNAIITCFLSAFDSLEGLDEIEEHCKIFLSLFTQLGGPPGDAAFKIKRSICTTANEKFPCLELNLMYSN